MFCHKCGQESPEGSAFCQKCGAKLIASGANQQAAPLIPIVPVQLQAPVAQAMNPAKKKSKKLPIIIGAAVLVVVIITLLFGFGEPSIDYVATARAWEPFAQSQGLPGTCGEVINKYIENQEWTTELDDEVAAVTVNGTLKGAEDKVSVTITVEPNEAGDGIISNFSHASINDEQSADPNEATLMMAHFFTAYDDGDETIVLTTNQQEVPQSVSLTETYTSDVDGITFQYPSGWKPITGDAVFDYIESNDQLVVLLVNDIGIGDELSIIQINAAPGSQEEIDGLFVSDEEFPEAFGSGISVIETGIVYETNSGTPIRAISYLDNGLYYNTFMYGYAGSIYRIDFVNKPETKDSFDPFYGAIMETYTIDTTGVSNGSGMGSVGFAGQGVSGGSEAGVLTTEEMRLLVEEWLVDHPLWEGELTGVVRGAFQTDEIFVFNPVYDGITTTDTINVDPSSGELYGVIFGNSASTTRFVPIDEWYQEVFGGVPASEYIIPGSFESATLSMLVNTGGPYLNMREGPGTDYELNGKIPDGTILEVTETMDSWGSVSYEGSYGWVSLEFLEPVQ